MKTYEVGVVGAGTIARQAHLPVLLNMPNVRVAWVTDADPSRAAGIAAAFRVRLVARPTSPTGLPPCDAALLAIPVGVRTEYYEAFAERGTGVFAEKPFAVSLGEHKRLVGLFPEHLLGCGYVRRTYATTGLLRRAVAEGWFGPLLRIRIAEGLRETATGVDHSHYEDVDAAGGGVLISIGCHVLDLAFFLTGAQGYEVVRKDLVMDGAVDRKVEARVRLQGVAGAGGCVFDFCVSRLDTQENVVELEFPALTLSVGLLPESPVTLRPRGKGAGTAQLLSVDDGARTIYQGFFLEWDWFLRGLETSSPSLMTARSGLPTAALIDELYDRKGYSA
jgi:predicted dehydrogenase